MLLFMNHCNDFAPCGPSIGQYNSYSYRYCKSSSLAKADDPLYSSSSKKDE